MKRFLKNLCLVCALVCASTFCASNATKVTASQTAEEANASSSSGIVRLNGYEHTKDLNSTYMYNELGKIELETKEKEYIKSGEGSAKLTVIKDIFDASRSTVYPTFSQSHNNVFRGLECKDFSKTVGVGFDIYNATGVEDKVGVQLVYYRTYHSSMSTSPLEWISLQPGWNTVFVDVVRENIPKTDIRNPITGFTTTAPFVVSTSLMFERNPEEGRDKIFYVDDFRLYKTDTEASAATEQLPVKAGELCSFDQPWQIDKLRFSASNQAYKCMGSWTKEFSSDGNAALKLDLPASEGARHTTYIQMYTSQYFVDCNLMDYDDNDLFRFEIYSPLEGGFNGNIGLYLCVSSGFFFWENISVVPGQVTQVCYTVEELNTLGKKHSDAGVGNSTAPDEYNCFKNMTYLQMGVSTSARATTLFIDNMRMEKVEG